MRPRLFVLSLVTALLAAAATAATAGEIRLASLARPGTAPYTLAWKFKELVEARSAGRLTVTVDPAGTPARESEVLDRLRSGGLDLAIITAGSLEGLVPTTRVLSFPFLFLTGEEADRVLDGVQGAALLRDVEAIGCKGLGFTEGGFRHLTNSIRPVRTAADVRDLKIRVTGSPVQTAFWSALGARPTPGPWPIYADLEAGVLEGQDNTLRVVETFGFDEVQPYLSLTRHAYIAYLNLASLHWWSLLSPGDQQLVQTAMSEATRFQRQDQRVRDAARVPVLMGRGMQVEEHPDLASFRARSAGLRDHLYFRDPRVQTLLARMQEAVTMPAPATVTEPARPAVTALTAAEPPGGDGAVPTLPMTAPALDQAAPGPIADEPPAAPALVEPDQPTPPDTPAVGDPLPAAPPVPAVAPTAPPVPVPVTPEPPVNATVPQPPPAPVQAPERIVHPGRDSEGGEAPIIEERIPPSPAPAPPPALTPSPGDPAALAEPPAAPAVPDATGTGGPLQQP